MDVALIQWPSDEDLRQELAEKGHPRLLLVESDSEPPECTDVLEDWVRLPVSRSDRNARIKTLQSRNGSVSSPVPTIDSFGTLEYSGVRTQLSAVQASLLEVLVDRIGAVVGREEICSHVWPGSDSSANNLDVAIGRLRRQIEPLGLRIKTVRSRGYLLHVVESA